MTATKSITVKDSKKFDLAVIGAGPGGYVAAIRASQLGLKVAIIEGNHLGGICLNWGCIPTKALLKSAEAKQTIDNSEEFGFSIDKVKINFDKIISRSRSVAGKLSSGIAALLKKNKVELFDGFASFIDSQKISVSKNSQEIATIEANHFIIATGARARVIAGIEPDNNLIWTYREAMTAKELPKSLIVVGSGAIGIEFASFYRALGVEVTIIEMAKQILPIEDAEIAKLATKSFEKQGIKIFTEAQLQKVDKLKNQVTAHFKIANKDHQITADRIIMAVGVVANIENIGLEKTKVKVENGRINVNQYLETTDGKIFAIGDVAGAPWLAHKASHEGIIAAEKIASYQQKYDAKKIHPINVNNIPGCTYSMPQIASLGLTEEKAKLSGREIKIGKFPYLANGKAIASSKTDGLIKVIFDKKTGELLGAHLIGEAVTEMIQTFVVAKQAELTEEDLIHTIFAHPTLSEMIHEAVLDADSRAIHF